jgi:hypothetical protein
LECAEWNSGQVEALVVAVDIELIVVIRIPLHTEGASDEIRILNHYEGKRRALLLSKVINGGYVHDQVETPIEAHSYCLGAPGWDAHLEFHIRRQVENIGAVKLWLVKW